MEKADRIIDMLEKQDETLQKHSQMLQEHGQKLEEHSQMLQKQDQKLHEQDQKLQEHSQILNALRSGQEHLKAELDSLKTTTNESFADLKRDQADTNTKLEVLHNDTWTNKVDIQRIKNTMGME